MFLAGPDVCITELVAADFLTVLTIYNSNPFYNQLHYGVDQLSDDILQKEFARTKSLESGYWLGIRYQDQLVGVIFLLIENPDDHKSWLGTLLLHAKYQQLNIGRECVTLLENHLRAVGRTSLHVGVHAHLDGALRFWGKLGFEQYRQVQHSMEDSLMPVILLAKKL